MFPLTAAEPVMLRDRISCLILPSSIGYLRLVPESNPTAAIFENRNAPLLPITTFRRRMVACFGIAFLTILAGVGIGLLGYRYLAGFSWVDSLLNACMILGGMGPVGALPNDGAKIFASFYALFSGLVFISVVALLIAPLAHRMLHRFHLAAEDVDSEELERSGSNEKN
jgi:hypothetical protein